MTVRKGYSEGWEEGSRHERERAEKAEALIENGTRLMQQALERALAAEASIAYMTKGLEYIASNWSADARVTAEIALGRDQPSVGHWPALATTDSVSEAPKLEPLDIVEDRTPEQLASDGDHHPECVWLPGEDASLCSCSGRGSALRASDAKFDGRHRYCDYCGDGLSYATSIIGGTPVCSDHVDAATRIRALRPNEAPADDGLKRKCPKCMAEMGDHLVPDSGETLCPHQVYDARRTDKVIPAPRHDPYIGPLTQDEKDDLSSWRVDFGFRHGLSEAAEIDLQEKFDELCTPMPGATDDPRRGNALDYANAEMHPGVVAVLDAAERLAEEVWSDSRLDEELEVLCHAVQAMRDAETMVTDEQGAEAAARLGIDVPKWAAEIRAKVHYPRFACVKCGDPWTPNPEVCGGAAYHVWQPFVGERNRPDSAKSGES